MWLYQQQVLSGTGHRCGYTAPAGLWRPDFHGCSSHTRLGRLAKLVLLCQLIAKERHLQGFPIHLLVATCALALLLAKRSGHMGTEHTRPQQSFQTLQGVVCAAGPARPPTRPANRPASRPGGPSRPNYNRPSGPPRQNNNNSGGGARRNFRPQEGRPGDFVINEDIRLGVSECCSACLRLLSKIHGRSAQVSKGSLK